MKILHMVAGGPQGGAETFCLDSIKVMHELKAEQYVICRPHKTVTDALDARNIPYQTLSFRRHAKFFEQRRIRKAIKDFQPDILNSWMRRASSFVPEGMTMPVLGWFGGYYNLKYYQKCDYFMGVTKRTLEHISQNSGKPHRSFLVHTFGTLEDAPAVSREDFKIPVGHKVVLLLSRMHPVKGIDTLLKSLQQVESACFLIAGDGPEMGKYQAMAKELGVADKVRFLGWRDDRAALLEISDICALPSRSESFGTVIPEAWSRHVPMIATKADGARQYVTHEVDGLLCEIDDVDGLANCFNRAIKDDALLARLKENGYKNYSENFTKPVLMRELQQAYQHILTEGKPTPHFTTEPDVSLPENLHQGLVRKYNENLTVISVAKTYYALNEDVEKALLAARMQGENMYDFTANGSPGQIELLSDGELSLMDRNFETLQSLKDF
jgi:glycosyltransferase involved in cell wall biosynthesis